MVHTRLMTTVLEIQTWVMRSGIKAVIMLKSITLEFIGGTGVGSLHPC